MPPKPVVAAGGATSHILPFYGHGKSQPYGAFSNFFWHPEFEFVIPESCRRCDGVPRSVGCAFSEKAIMLCKASVMGDLGSFHAIERAQDPAQAKALGRQVSPFIASTWESVIREVAFETVYQKFEKVPGLRELLLSTGDKVLVEAAKNDRIWGVGLDATNPKIWDQNKWQGQNILGTALMEARKRLSETQGLQPSPSERCADRALAEGPEDPVVDLTADDAETGTATPPSNKKPRWSRHAKKVDE